jgi:hypothetical protein
MPRLSLRTGFAAMLVPVLTLALAACGDAGASAPGGVSAGEAKALEDAAAMLDERRLPPAAIPPEAVASAPGQTR